MSPLLFKYKFWIEDQDGVSIFGDGKYKLLKTIEETGSFKHAVARLNLSYRKTWDKVRTIEERLGYPILETQQGGLSGGTTTLTPAGKQLMEIFERLHALCDPFFTKMTQNISAGK
ncbi:MAG: LysR family transcriptional regulator [Bacteroidales bacterium]|jgi:molybdate transport system regulatory protein|nr:LysR family transcriptional regulator [Bacteroidales bacterium]MDD2264344.1 LysR family transcriptional regulator [Bacteroidales bacterium]MDD2831578.1 LysR family transcriptional regulator [Bacteroidales bacterium]MDD3208572.1 LysR family transcriptional regulator [Bacteroidales bacterium]MDD3697015.1 LysR family transcriptional regulator [Bacteroidales bacterium]